MHKIPCSIYGTCAPAKKLLLSPLHMLLSHVTSSHASQPGPGHHLQTTGGTREPVIRLHARAAPAAQAHTDVRPPKRSHCGGSAIRQRSNHAVDGQLLVSSAGVPECAVPSTNPDCTCRFICREGQIKGSADFVVGCSEDLSISLWRRGSVLDRMNTLEAETSCILVLSSKN